MAEENVGKKGIVWGITSRAREKQNERPCSVERGCRHVAKVSKKPIKLYELAKNKSKLLNEHL